MTHGHCVRSPSHEAATTRLESSAYEHRDPSPPPLPPSMSQFESERADAGSREPPLFVEHPPEGPPPSSRPRPSVLARRRELRKDTVRQARSELTEVQVSAGRRASSPSTSAYADTILTAALTGEQAQVVASTAATPRYRTVEPRRRYNDEADAERLLINAHEAVVVETLSLHPHSLSCKRGW
jgi:hypothetical protein